MEHVEFKLKVITAVLLGFAVSSCSNGGSNTIGSSGNAGDASKLTFIAPNIIPSISGKDNIGYIEVDNTTETAVSGINYNLGDMVGSGINVQIESTSADKCREIASGKSCVFGVVIPSGSVSGSFSLSASNNGLLANENSKTSTLPTNPIIGVGQVLYNNLNGADGINLYYYQIVAAGLPYIVVTGVVASNVAGNFNNVILVDNNNVAIPGQQIISGNLGAGLPDLGQGATFSIILPVPSGDNVTQTIKVRTEQVAADGSITNPQLGSTSSTLTTVSGVGIVNMIPSSVYLTSSAPSQQLTFTNSSDSSASLESLISSNPNVRVIFTPGPLGNGGSMIVNSRNLKAGNSSTATLELINPDLPPSSGDLTLTYNNGRETITQSITLDQNIIPGPTPAPTPTPTPSPTPTPVPVPNITITPVPDPLGNIMMGNGFQFTAAISVTGSSTISATFVNPASGVITSNPSPCVLDLSGVTSCTFTVTTMWNSSLANDSSLNYQIAINATNGATVSGSPANYTQITSGIYLPQTGQTPTSPITAPTGSDGDVHAGIPWAYVTSGSTVPNPRFTDNGCDVTDNLTGLIWLKTPITSYKSWQDALNIAESGTWCSQSSGSWRIPNIAELRSLFNYSINDQADWLNNQGFSGVSYDDAYWTSTTVASNVGDAFAIDFWGARVMMNSKTSTTFFFPVRGSSVESSLAKISQTGQTDLTPINNPPAGSDGALQQGIAWPAPRFSFDSSGNCITDQLTGLMWVRDLNTVSTTAVSWENALTVANGGNWCGYTDWRIPNINELASIINYGYSSPANWLMYGSGDAANPACNGTCFVNVQAGGYWSSSSNTDSPTQAWHMNFSNANMGVAAKVLDNMIYMWPVRGGN